MILYLWRPSIGGLDRKFYAEIDRLGVASAKVRSNRDSRNFYWSNSEVAHILSQIPCICKYHTLRRSI